MEADFLLGEFSQCFLFSLSRSYRGMFLGVFNFYVVVLFL